MKQHMRSIRVAAALAALSLSMAFGSALGEEGKKEVTSQTFGDWVLQCPADESQKKEMPCTLTQQIIAEKAKAPIVTVAFVYAGEPASLHTLMRTPLGVAIPPGVTLQIDSGEVSRWQFNHCEPGGCMVTSKVGQDLRKKLESGNKAQIGFHSVVGQKIGVPASLRGITAGLKELTK